jgi:hypothetical protein
LSSTSKFDALLLESVDETIRYCLGDVNAQLIYSYLERKGIPKQDIPKNLDAFVMEFENVVGFGRGQILGAAQILEEAILKAFCVKLKIAYTEGGSRYFPDQIRRLKETYDNGSLKGVEGLGSSVLHAHCEITVAIFCISFVISDRNLIRASIFCF